MAFELCSLKSLNNTPSRELLFYSLKLLMYVIENCASATVFKCTVQVSSFHQSIEKKLIQPNYKSIPSSISLKSTCSFYFCPSFMTSLQSRETLSYLFMQAYFFNLYFFNSRPQCTLDVHVYIYFVRTVYQFKINRNHKLNLD